MHSNQDIRVGVDLQLMFELHSVMKIEQPSSSIGKILLQGSRQFLFIDHLLIIGRS